MVGPQVVSGTEEVDRKLSDVMRQITDIEWNYFGITDLSRPPSD